MLPRCDIGRAPAGGAAWSLVDTGSRVRLAFIHVVLGLGIHRQHQQRDDQGGEEFLRADQQADHGDAPDRPGIAQAAHSCPLPPCRIAPAPRKPTPVATAPKPLPQFAWGTLCGTRCTIR